MTNLTNRSRTHLSFVLAALLPGALGAACSSEQVSAKGQTITCSTDPGTGVILRCEPGGGGSGSGGSGTCVDVDDDGDGEPHDDGTIARNGVEDDDDGDGIPNEEDCDEHQGEDSCDDHGGDSSSVDLPYDVKPQLGATATPILDAFAEKGAAPAEIVSVTLDGGSWRLAELQASTPFVVTNDDCTHVGNRDVGRDRVIVTWRNADGSTESDHLDIRYCAQ